MATFFITLKVTFDPVTSRTGKVYEKGSGLLRLNAPRVWKIFTQLGSWSKFVSNVEIMSITDPDLTEEEEQGMTSNWKLQNHGLEGRVEERR
jgi:hypothetical protein